MFVLFQFRSFYFQILLSFLVLNYLYWRPLHTPSTCPENFHPMQMAIGQSRFQFRPGAKSFFWKQGHMCASFILLQKYALDPRTRKSVNLLVTFLKVLFHLDLTLCSYPVIFRPFSSLYSWSYWEVSNCAIRSKKDYCVLQTRMATFASCEIRSRSDTTWHLSVKVTRGRQY